MMGNPDAYFSRTEVSNSDLTELKNFLYPRIQYGDKEAAFKFGTLVDALITENDRVRYDKLMVDDYVYTQDEFEHGLEMRKALRKEAERDQFLAIILSQSDTQRFMVNQQQEFHYGCFAYHLDTRCKWDWWLPAYGFGGDLKTTFAESQKQFDEAIDFFDWDRSRAWYMDIAGSSRDFIYAISKKNYRIFKHFITDRNHSSYKHGREKYNDLAFKWWQLMV